jgi:hypothetical protein
MNLAALISSVINEFLSSIESIDVDSKDVKVKLSFKKEKKELKQIKGVK